MGEHADIKDRIKQLRLARGWSQQDLADKLNVTNVAVSQWERGVKQPKLEMREALCDLFNVNMEYLNGNWDKISRLVTEEEAILLDSKRDQDRPLPTNISVPAAHGIPILGTICCGDGIYAEQNYDGMFFVDSSIKADCCLHVHGDSMIDAGIRDGDIAFIQKGTDIDDGDICGIVLRDSNEAVLKKIFKSDGHLILQPCNTQYKPIIEDPDNVLIVGEMVGVYHKMK